MSERVIYLIGHREVEPRWRTARTSFTPTKKWFDYYKIGIATDVRDRLNNLSVGTPHELELITTVESSDPKEVEDRLHFMHSFSRQKGEWFFLTSNTVNSLTAFDRLEVSDLDGVDRSEYINDSSLYIEVMRNREQSST